MYTLGVSGGVVAFLVQLLVIRLVKRFGDLKGIWIPANVFALLYAVTIVLIPSTHWQLSYISFPLLGGPGGTLTGFTPELLAKLVPPDVQGTFQTAKAFLYDSQRAVMVWPWLGLLLCSEDFAYPWDSLSIWVAMLLGIITLWLTLKRWPVDPKNAILEGKALEDFWETPYVKRKWYRLHGGMTETHTLHLSTKQDGATEGMPTTSLEAEPDGAAVASHSECLAEDSSVVHGNSATQDRGPNMMMWI